MELSERKVKILKAIIQNYLDTGEPVGSRTISKYTDLNLSSATIRNEMSDLEEMGYLMQPHTSAGRIPSDKGYRFYVDTMFDEKEQEVEELHRLLTEKADQVDQLLQQAAKVLAVNTNYATMITSPKYTRNKLKFIQLSNVSEDQLLVVVVADGNVVRNKVIHMDEELDNETLLKLNILLNTNLTGIPMEDINLGMFAKLREQAGIHSEVINGVLIAVAESINVEDLQVYTSGVTNMLKYPELMDKGTAQELMEVFEEKQELAGFIQDNFDTENSHGVQIYIGTEAPNQNYEDCSVVTATYELGEGMKGTIGIIGPKRMDYKNVVRSLKNLKQELDEIYHNNHKTFDGKAE